MLRLLAVALWLTPAVFLASPLTADDLYGAPDPGWYNQGSGRPTNRGAGGAYGYRGSDAGRNDYGGYGSLYDDWVGEDAGRRSAPSTSFRQPPSQRSGGEYDAWDTAPADDAYDARRYTEPSAPGGSDPTSQRADRWSEPDADPARSSNGYGAPDWAQPSAPADSRGDWRRQGDYAPGSADSSPSVEYAPDQGPWRTPASRPRYRFRDDPSLEPRAGGGQHGDYEFRPLSPREQGRRQRSDEDPRFVAPDRGRRYRSQPKSQRGTAFGYAPGAPPAHATDDFYQRYYRSGP